VILIYIFLTVVMCCVWIVDWRHLIYYCRYSLFLKSLKWLGKSSQSASQKSCGNRHEESLNFDQRDGRFQVSVTFVDLNEPDLYSREELLNMLILIRSHGINMKWKVPKPTKSWYYKPENGDLV
jgi:hypothetical protein